MDLFASNGKNDGGVADYWRAFFFVFMTLFAVTIVSAHFLDIRNYYKDVGFVLSKSLLLVDRGEFVWSGNPIHKEFMLGPLSHLLLSIPLLLSRDIRVAYVFMTLLMFLSVIVFFFAARRMIPSGPFRWVATLSFTTGILVKGHPLTPLNTYLLPIFLALFFFFFVSATRGDNARLFLAWVAVLLCIQLHLMCVLLVPAMLAATGNQRWKGRRLVTLAGLLLIPATNFQWFFQLPLFLKNNAGLAVPGTSVGALVFSTRLFLHFIYFPFQLLITSSFPVMIFLPFAAAGFRRIRANFPDEEPFFRGAAASLISAAVLIPLIFTLKNQTLLHYFDCLLVFFAVLVGLYFQWIAERPLSPKPKIFVVAAFLSPLWIFFNSSFFTGIYPSGLHLNDQIRVAEKVRRTIEQEDLRYIKVEGRLCFAQQLGSIVRVVDEPSQTYQALILYKNPELRDRFSDYSNQILFVDLIMKAHPPPDEMKTAPSHVVRDLGTFETQRLAGRLYLIKK